MTPHIEPLWSLALADIACVFGDGEPPAIVPPPVLIVVHDEELFGEEGPISEAVAS